MKLFILSLIAAIVSGYFAWRFDENKALYFVTFIISLVTTLISGTRLIPETLWIAYTPYFYGGLLVLGFWSLRTQVRNALLK